MEFIAGADNTKHIKQLLREKGPINCAVAFWGMGAEDLFGSESRRTGRVRILCNLESGCTNPDVIEKLRKRPGFKVRSTASLHAKVYWTNCSAIVGSANASTNGLALEGGELAGWIEAGVTVNDPNVLRKIEKWFDQRWAKAKDVNKVMLKDARHKWRERPNHRRTTLKVKLDDATLRDRLKEREIYLAIYRDPPSQEAEEKWKEITTGPGMGFYEDWKGIPRKAIVIDMYYKRSGNPEFEGTFKTNKTREAIPLDGSKGEIELVEDLNHHIRNNRCGEDFREDANLALTFRKNYEKPMMRHAKDIWEEAKPQSSEDGRVIKIEKLLQILKPLKSSPVRKQSGH